MSIFFVATIYSFCLDLLDQNKAKEENMFQVEGLVWVYEAGTPTHDTETTGHNMLTWQTLKKAGYDTTRIKQRIYIYIYIFIHVYVHI